MATTLHQSGTVVVGYFADGYDAHRAINALIDQGFLPSEIGAAFHVTSAGEPRANETQRPAVVGESLRDELGTTQPGAHAGSSTTFGAPASDSTAVQPGALGGGAGTPFGGAGRPGPISGSSLANSGLPSELKSTLPHDSEVRGGETPVATTHHSTETVQHGHGSHANEGLVGKLKHLFGQHDTAPKSGDTLQAEVAADSRKFGTGEGDLHLADLSKSHRYSQKAFESSFSGYGVPAPHAHHLSHQIGHGGAVVTVHAAARAVEAERVLEANGGEVRFNGTESTSVSAGEGYVEVFGTHRDYQGFIS